MLRFLVISILVSGVWSLCGSDYDCLSLQPDGRAVCREQECSCRSEFAEEHEFAADGSKSVLHCRWPTPIWFWTITHFITFVTPVILAGLGYLMYTWCRDSCCRRRGASQTETRALIVPRNKREASV